MTTPARRIRIAQAHRWVRFAHHLHTHALTDNDLRETRIDEPVDFTSVSGRGHDPIPAHLRGFEAITRAELDQENAA